MTILLSTPVLRLFWPTVAGAAFRRSASDILMKAYQKNNGGSSTNAPVSSYFTIPNGSGGQQPQVVALAHPARRTMIPIPPSAATGYDSFHASSFLSQSSHAEGPDADRVSPSEDEGALPSTDDGGATAQAAKPASASEASASVAAATASGYDQFCNSSAVSHGSGGSMASLSDLSVPPPNGGRGGDRVGGGGVFDTASGGYTDFVPASPNSLGSSLAHPVATRHAQNKSAASLTGVTFADSTGLLASEEKTAKARTGGARSTVSSLWPVAPDSVEGKGGGGGGGSDGGGAGYEQFVVQSRGTSMGG